MQASQPRRMAKRRQNKGLQLLKNGFNPQNANSKRNPSTKSLFVILHFLQDYGRRLARRLRMPLDVAERVGIRHFPSRFVRLGSIRLCAVRHGS